MKKVFLTAALIIGMIISAQAQIYYVAKGQIINVNSSDVEYIQANAWSNLLGTKITQFRFDFAQKFGLYGSDVSNSKGQKVKFHSAMNMVNYFYKNGWDLYKVSDNSKIGSFNYIFKRRKDFNR